MITTVTLNASIDKVYRIDRLKKGTIMRVKELSSTPGGKGLNVAKAVKLCGGQVLATGFAGGHAGAYLEEQLDRIGVGHRFQHIGGETRSCINILDEDGISTELLEPGAVISRREMEEFLELYQDVLEESRVVAISGSLPRGVEPCIYADLIHMAKDRGMLTILDSSGDALRKGLEAIPYMIKPNREELEAYLRRSLTDERELIRAAKEIREMGIKIVVLSLGEDGAIAVSDSGIYRGRPPEVKAVNPAGCGDAMVAAFAVAFERGQGVEEALRYAIAVSAANTLTMTTGDFHPSDVDRLFCAVQLEKLSID